MAQPSRRVPPPNSQYYAVPQSPVVAGPSRQQSVTGSYGVAGLQQGQPQRQPSSSHQSHINGTTQGVATGVIGGGYGPYSYNPTLNSGNALYTASRFSNAPSEVSLPTTAEKTVPIISTSSTQPYPYIWDTKDPDLDDALHNPDPIRDAKMENSCTPFSARGWSNLSALAIIVLGLLTLFVGYPIINWFQHPTARSVSLNLGGINATGQVPNLPNLPSLIDVDTDPSVHTRTGTDGQTYNLVFSDEFEQDGRTFWPGDDPFWEAVNLNYWPTGDLEWYDPSQLTTQDGKLVITMDEVENHNLNFRSGMLQSWNKFCFTTGYIEISLSLPGSPTAPGLWPAAWTMGNLGRAGYGATTEGMWPYSYDACDVGTFPNQTTAAGAPAAATTGGIDGGPLSFMPGQRVSACTCPQSDHPGPSVNVGRGVPEIDVIEAQIDVSRFQTQASQSFQVAPYNYQYTPDNNASTLSGATSQFNSYKGGVYQQAVSALTDINNADYADQSFGTYGFEWWSNPSNRDEGYVTWFADGQPAWTMTAATIGADPVSQISSRLIPEEPMYIIFNLGMSPSFQKQDFMHLTFPSKMYVDYVRVYQRSDVTDSTTCEPANYPTQDYINNHINAYSNPNLTTWDQAGYTFPRNSQYDGC